MLPLEGDKKPVPFLSREFNEGQARFSPDGHWVAYTSDESGQNEVYVRSFSMNSAGTAVEAGGKWKISDGFGTDPRWRGDGRELYYLSRGGGLLAVEIATNPAFRAGKPQTCRSFSLRVWQFVWRFPVGFRRGRQAFSQAGGQERTAAVHGGAELASRLEEISSCTP